MSSSITETKYATRLIKQKMYLHGTYKTLRNTKFKNKMMNFKQ